MSEKFKFETSVEHIMETERLWLKLADELLAADLSRLIFQDPKVMEHSDHGVFTHEEVVEWIHCAQKSYQENGYGPWVVVEKQSQNLVGYCGLFRHEINGIQEVEIGYRLAINAQGKGLATEATSAVLEYAKTNLHLPRIVALIDPNNAPSRNVAEKLSFYHESDVLMPGYDHPDHLYAKELQD